MKRAAWLMLALLAAPGCDDVADMRQQPRVDAFAPSRLQQDASSARPVPLGAVSIAGVVAEPLETGAPPRPPVTLELLKHGQVLFDIHCSVCHGRDAYGRGMVVQRGFPEPPSFHTQRLRELPDEYIFRVITEGLGKMPSYAADVAAPDRWAVIGYVRALQLSQNAQLSDAPAPLRRELQSAPAQAPSENPEKQP